METIVNAVVHLGDSYINYLWWNMIVGKGAVFIMIMSLGYGLSRVICWFREDITK